MASVGGKLGRLALCVLGVMLCVVSVLGYPEGAGTCDADPTTISDGMSGPLNTVSPFFIDASRASYTPGGSPLTISVPGEFKGLLLYAESASGREGTFTYDNTYYQPKLCDGRTDGNTITHRDAMTKTMQSFTWNPPSTDKSTVTLRMVNVVGPSSNWYISTKTLLSCPANAILVDNNQCVASCPNARPKQSSGTCVASCPAQAPFEDNNICLVSCPNARPYSNQNVCVEDCQGTRSLLDEMTCVSSCPVQRPFNDTGECVVDCPNDQPVADEGTCTDVCSSARPYNSNGRCVSSCSGSFPFVSGSNCVGACPAATPVADEGVCTTSCPADKKFIYQQVCSSSCPSGTSADDNNVCSGAAAIAASVVTLLAAVFVTLTLLS